MQAVRTYQDVAALIGQLSARRINKTRGNAMLVLFETGKLMSADHAVIPRPLSERCQQHHLEFAAME